MPKRLKCTENAAKAAFVDVFLMQIIVCEVLVIQAYAEITRVISRIKSDT
jgi:hypothetical protein